MNWFKHDSNATTDAKIKKLIIRYGAIGYAIYFHCLELIASNVSETNITFELEHDAEIIADDLRIKGDSNKSGIEIVEEIMRFMCDLDLFEESSGHIFCFKLLKRLDTSMTSSPKMRELISKAKKNQEILYSVNHDDIMTNHDDIMQEQIRTDKNRKEYLNTHTNILTDIDSENENVKQVCVDKDFTDTQQNYAKTILDIFKNADLPCWNGNYINFIQQDFKNAIPIIRSFHSDDVIQACRNYVKILRDPEYWPSYDMSFYSFVKSTLFEGCLPQNFKLEMYLDKQKSNNADSKAIKKSLKNKIQVEV